MPYSNTVYVSIWEFCLCMHGIRGIVWIGRHLLFLNAQRRFLNGQSTLWERSCQERWKIITSLHTFITPWIFMVFVRSSNEHIFIDQSANRSRKRSKEVEFAICHNEFQDGHTKRQTMKVSLKMLKRIVMNWDNRQKDDPIYMRTKFWIWADFPSTSN